MIVLQSLASALANTRSSHLQNGEPIPSLGWASMGRVPAREPFFSSLCAFASLREPPPAIRPICRIRPIHSPSDLHFCPKSPHPKSTLSHPKSTVDLGLPALIWDDNALRTLQMTILCRSKLFGIQGNLTAFRNQTEIKPNQAGKLFPTLDLGCLQSSSWSLLPSFRSPRGYFLLALCSLCLCGKKLPFCETNPIVRIAMVRQSPGTVQRLSNPVQPNPSQSNHFEEKIISPPGPNSRCMYAS
jgi:hypothetical protein